MARKQNKKPHSAPNRILRKALEDGEKYATVTKLFGGSRCEVLAIDGQACQCIIRNKFRGRGRRANFLSPGTWCLVGEREWSRAVPGKNPIVDLLHVYDADHKGRLQREVHADWHILLAETQSTTSETVCFATDDSDLAVESASAVTDDLVEGPDDDIVDVDDI